MTSVVFLASLLGEPSCGPSSWTELWYSCTLCESNAMDPDSTCSRHEELLANRWLKHESQFKSVAAQGSGFFMLTQDKQ